MEGFDVKAALDSLLVFVAQNYLLPVWFLVPWLTYRLGYRRGYRRGTWRPWAEPLRPEMVELLARLEEEEKEHDRLRAESEGFPPSRSLPEKIGRQIGRFLEFITARNSGFDGGDHDPRR